jgi:hypothetical protein
MLYRHFGEDNGQKIMQGKCFIPITEKIETFYLAVTLDQDTSGIVVSLYLLFIIYFVGYSDSTCSVSPVALSVGSTTGSILLEHVALTGPVPFSYDNLIWASIICESLNTKTKQNPRHMSFGNRCPG